MGPRVGPVSALPAADHPDPRGAAIRAPSDPALRDIVDLVLWVEDDDGRRVACAARQSAGCGGTPAVCTRCSRASTLLPARTRWPSCCTTARWPRPGRAVGRQRLPVCRGAHPVAVRRPDPQPRPRRRAHAAHWFPDEGGHVGEHGSLDVIQSRAPLVLSGAGVRRLGAVDSHARLVDVGPTLATMAGVAEAALRDAQGAALDAPRSRRTCRRGVPLRGRGWWASCGTAPTAVSCCTWPGRGSCRPCAG